MSSILSTAPHRLRKKRELTRAVELLETLVGREGEVHRGNKGPIASLPKVFTSLPNSRFTVKGCKVSTLKSLASLTSYTPPGDHLPMGLHINVLGSFEEFLGL
jgi:hypothetical protein